MDELNRAYEALEKAHKAGDEEGAKKIAAYARSLEEGSKADNYEAGANDEGLGIPESAIGATIGSTLGAAIAPTVGSVVDTGTTLAAKAINPAAASEAGVPNGPGAVRKWLATQTSAPYAGGKDYKEASKKSKIAAGEPIQSRGSNIAIRKGNLGIGNQLPETTLPQKAAANILNAEKAGKPGIARRMAGMGVAGAEIGSLIEEAKKGNVGRATLSGIGALGGLASQSNIKPLRAIGTGISAAVPAIQYLLPSDEEPEKHADGGIVQHLADGGKPKNKVKKILKNIPMPQTASLGANLLLGASDIEQSHQDLQNNLQRGNYGSAANNAIDLGSTVSPYFMIPSIYQGGRELSKIAAGQLAHNPQHRQQMQSMSSNPMGGAMAGDAGLAAQIMGRHQYEEDPGEYGHLLRGSKLPGYVKGGKVFAKVAAKMSPGMSDSLNSKPMSLAEKFGYDPVKLRNEYPQTSFPVSAWDKNKESYYAAKNASPEELALKGARDFAQGEITSGSSAYKPYFDISKRGYVDPTNYPLPGPITTSVIPKQQKTIDAYTAKFQNPEAIQKWDAAYELAKNSPNAHHFYAMDQLEKEYVKAYGPELGRQKFKNEFADQMANTTSGVTPTNNLLTAGYVNHMNASGRPLPGHAPGEYTGYSFDAPHPVQGGRIGANLAQSNKYAEAGNQLNPLENPKRYNFSGDFMGHPGITMDEQMMTPFGMAAPPKGSYGLAELEGAKQAALKGADPTDWQSVTWAGLKALKDSKGKELSPEELSKIGQPMIEDVNQMIHRTSRVLGISQKEALNQLLKNKPIYGIGAISAGEVTNQNEVKPNKKGGKVKK